MKRQNLDKQWRFHYTQTPVDWWLERPEGVIVDLPHDYSIIQQRDPDTRAGASNGFFPGGLGVYEKKLFVPEDWKCKKVILEFEGVYMNAAVYINNHIVGRHPYGYTSFHCDLTPYLHYGEDNTIRVDVNNNALPNTRWYSGSGIYRHVWLLTGEKINIVPWGVYATTQQTSADTSAISVKTAIENSDTCMASVKIRSTLMDGSGMEVACVETETDICEGSRTEVQQALSVVGARLWSVEDPYLYTLKSEIIKDGMVIDSTENKIGIRWISVDAKKGFCLNGTSMKLKGGCVHHDCGLLGAASYDRAEERKVELLKAGGYNAVRCAHNPPSPAFLDVCDRLGMLVINEAFDCWREPKNPNDYAVNFEDWWQRDITSMVLRDRNHPCVIMWSTGNEIPERSGRSEGYAYARKLADFVRSLDNTRPITNALNGISKDAAVNGLAANLLQNTDDYDYWGELSYQFVEPLDVVGYNYLLDRYESDGKKFPDRVICGSETFAKDIFDYWSTVERLSYVIGDFVWTGIDYLGEAGLGHIWYNGEKSFLGDYPWHQAFCGDYDICGFKRPQSYYRDCVWGISNAPYIAVYKPQFNGKTPDMSPWAWPDVQASWTWPGFEGEMVKVEIYSAEEEVELSINGRSLGRKPAGKLNRYIAEFQLEYEPGELIARAYRNSAEISKTVLRTAGNPASLRLTPDRKCINAGPGDLSYITVEVLDALGNVVHNACNNIHFDTCGAGKLLAVGSGNPVSEEMYVGNQRRLHEGRAMVVLASTGETGELTLTASSEGIAPAQVTIDVI